MSSIVKRLMEALADDEERYKRKPEILKRKILKTRNYPDDDDDDPERVKRRS